LKRRERNSREWNARTTGHLSFFLLGTGKAYSMRPRAGGMVLIFLEVTAAYEIGAISRL
jgi:hypothetical protein